MAVAFLKPVIALSSSSYLSLKLGQGLSKFCETGTFSQHVSLFLFFFFLLLQFLASCSEFSAIKDIKNH